MFSNGYLSISNAIPWRDEEKSSQLQLHPRTPVSQVLFRTLLGGVRIDLKTGKSAVQTRNFFILDCPARSGFSLGPDVLRAFPGLGMQDRNGQYLSYTVIKSLAKFFSATGTNKGFFEVLLNELARSFVASENGSDLSAFVYVYRALEHMSCALPFFHARNATNYVKAFNDLRNLIASGDGELKFCDKFIGNIFASNPVCAGYKYLLAFDPVY